MFPLIALMSKVSQFGTDGGQLGSVASGVDNNAMSTNCEYLPNSPNKSYDEWPQKKQPDFGKLVLARTFNPFSEEHPATRDYAERIGLPIYLAFLDLKRSIAGCGLPELKVQFDVLAAQHSPLLNDPDIQELHASLEELVPQLVTIMDRCEEICLRDLAVSTRELRGDYVAVDQNVPDPIQLDLHTMRLKIDSQIEKGAQAIFAIQESLLEGIQKVAKKFDARAVDYYLSGLALALSHDFAAALTSSVERESTRESSKQDVPVHEIRGKCLQIYNSGDAVALAEKLTKAVEVISHQHV